MQKSVFWGLKFVINSNIYEETREKNITKNLAKGLLFKIIVLLEVGVERLERSG